MDIVVCHIERCPHVSLAESRVRQAVERLGIEATVSRVLVRSAAEAETLRFAGSPTILIDGEDPFPRSDNPAPACRMYITERGLEGAASVEQLVLALSRRSSA